MYPSSVPAAVKPENLDESAAAFALPPGSEERLLEYERFFSRFVAVPPNSLVLSYEMAPIHFSLMNVAGDAPEGSFRFERAGFGTTFGYQHAQTRTTVTDYSEAVGAVPRGVTFYLIDHEVLAALPKGESAKLLSRFGAFAWLSNHDLLHSLNGDPENFGSVDAHLRFGGVEFAPLVAHGACMRQMLASSAEQRSRFENIAGEYVDIAARMARFDERRWDGFAPRLYAASILLRRMLLVHPADAPMVRSFLDDAQSKLFENREVMVDPGSARRFLVRDFSQGDHLDQLPGDHPAHANRTSPYRHGADSMLRPWVDRLFRQVFGDSLDRSVSLPYKDMLLLDTLKRGFGIYAVQSAVVGSGDPDLVGRCAALVCDTPLVRHKRSKQGL